MKSNNYSPLPNNEMIWHINTAFNCIGVEIIDFINMILLNSTY